MKHAVVCAGCQAERLAGLFVVAGATIVFVPTIWLLQGWSEAVARDPAYAQEP